MPTAAPPSADDLYKLAKRLKPEAARARYGLTYERFWKFAEHLHFVSGWNVRRIVNELVRLGQVNEMASEIKRHYEAIAKHLRSVKAEPRRAVLAEVRKKLLGQDLQD